MLGVITAPENSVSAIPIDNDTGEMGDNLPYVDLGRGRTAKVVSSGGIHACAILDNDKIKCWGWNEYGQLGLGDTEGRGDDTGEMGDNLPYVDLGTGRTVKVLSSGDIHACAILDNDKIKCWGDNEYGQLGLGDTDHRGDDTGEMGDNLPYVDLGRGRTVKALSSGSYYTCAILDNDKIKCWGHNSSGELGLGDTDRRGDDRGEMGDNLPYVDLGRGRTAKVVSSGGIHACAILDNDKIKCWGWNGVGELGLGDTDDRGDDRGEMGDNLPYVDL